MYKTSHQIDQMLLTVEQDRSLSHSNLDRKIDFLSIHKKSIHKLSRKNINKEECMCTIKKLAILLLCFTVTACASMGAGNKMEKQQAIITMKDEVLTQLFAKKPDTRAQINVAPGYAVFSNANVNVIFIAAGTGYGVVKNMDTGAHTYMNMAEGGVGLGLGIKDYRIVVVFHTVNAMNNFVDKGWTFGGNADAAAKAGNKGASVEGELYYGDMTVYTFTDSGLALQATVKGTKFWKDKKLN
jgi:lipid-binding SYLF domain-containing protein